MCFLSFSGTSWDVNNTAVKHQDMEGASYDSTGITVSHSFFKKSSGTKKMSCCSFMSGELCKISCFTVLVTQFYGLAGP